MLLAIETATARGSIALIDAEGKIESVTLSEERNHGRSLAHTVKALVDGRESKIQAYGLSIGPGSFTGLRIGLAFLKGFGIVYPAPVAAVSTLKIVAAGSPPEFCSLPILAMMDARSHEVYAGLYRWNNEKWVVDAQLPDGLYRQSEVFSQFEDVDLLALGDGVVACPRGGEPPKIPVTWKQAQREHSWPKAETLAGLAWKKFEAGATVSLPELEPQYHQLSAAERNVD